MQELPFLHSARRLMLIDICMKFREASLFGLKVTERTRCVTDGQMDGQTPEEKQYVSQHFGGRHYTTKAIRNTQIECFTVKFFVLLSSLIECQSECSTTHSDC